MLKAKSGRGLFHAPLLSERSNLFLFPYFFSLILLNKNFMKTAFSLLFVVSLSLFCCSSKEDIERKDILTPEQLSSLLIDIYVAEAIVDNLPLAKDTSIKYFVPFEQKLLKSKNIPDSVLRKTYRYYLAHPKELENIYDVVIDSLTLREQKTDMIPQKDKPQSEKKAKKDLVE